MGIINIRIDDHTHAQLKELAETEGLSLSEYIRTLLHETTLPIREDSEQHGDLPVPESFSPRDRIMLALLHRILARVLPDDSNMEDGDLEHQLRLASIIQSGLTGEYWQEVAGFETELSKRDSRRVVDILQMFRIIVFSIKKLEGSGETIPEELAHSLEFRGFDHNNTLEGHMARYVRFMMEEDEWSELQDYVKKNDNGNSHMEMLPVYLRMTAEYRRIMDSPERGHRRDDFLLSFEDLQRIANARVHPSRR